MNGFVNNSNGSGVLFQGTRHKHVDFSQVDYSLSASYADEEGYFNIVDNRGVELPFQVVMEVGGRMMVLGKDMDKDADPQMMYFSAGENSYLVKRVYYVADNDATEFWVEY